MQLNIDANERYVCTTYFSIILYATIFFFLDSKEYTFHFSFFFLLKRKYFYLNYAKIPHFDGDFIKNIRIINIGSLHCICENKEREKCRNVV